MKLKSLKIYEIKKNPVTRANYSILKGRDGSFYWNDATFRNNHVGDYVFFVNIPDREVLFTELEEKDIPATFIVGKSRFRHHSKTFEVEGNNAKFINFKVIQSSSIPKDWRWTKSIRQSETYDLWKENGDLENKTDRIQKLNDLAYLFEDTPVAPVISGYIDQLSAEPKPPSITKFIEVANRQNTGHGTNAEAKQFAGENKRLYKDLKIQISFGIGRASLIPWIAFLGHDQRVKNGIYPVFLYFKPQGLLILSYGKSETNKPFHRWPGEQSLQTIEALFKSKGMPKPSSYGDSYVFKLYDANQNLNEHVVKDDLDNLIAIYHSTFQKEADMNPIASEPTPLGYKNASLITSLSFDNPHRQILTAAKTKPFVLLAGLSGIGKSRLARTLAYKTCTDTSLQDPQGPQNFLLIPVKPNWTDSSDLLGYESAITNSYKTTQFIKFLIKAWKHANVPFFLCMDEMNLAHVELYFAEYLSAIESRQKIQGKIVTDPLISKDIFKKYRDQPAFWLELDTDNYTREMLLTDGLRIPENLIVVGTVNMDETTHSFSRKVLDRAMTIEINDVDLNKLKETSQDWEYPDDYYSRTLVYTDYLAASEVADIFNEFDAILMLLTELNKALDKSPFKFAYRSAQEILLYCYHSLSDPINGTKYTDILDEVIFMKILPRIEGNEETCQEPLDNVKKIFTKEKFIKCTLKTHEMLDRLQKSGNTSFFHGSH